MYQDLSLLFSHPRHKDQQTPDLAAQQALEIIKADLESTREESRAEANALQLQVSELKKTLEPALRVVESLLNNLHGLGRN